MHSANVAFRVSASVFVAAVKTCPLRVILLLVGVSHIHRCKTPPLSVSTPLQVSIARYASNAPQHLYRCVSVSFVSSDFNVEMPKRLNHLPVAGYVRHSFVAHPVRNSPKPINTIPLFLGFGAYQIPVLDCVPVSHVSSLMHNPTLQVASR